MNPYEMQRRMAKACTIADKAEEMGFSASDLGKQDSREWNQWAALCGVTPPSKETWFRRPQVYSEPHEDGCAHNRNA